MLPVIVYAFIVSSLAFPFLFVMVEAMYENSPEYFKKFQKRFKYNICETEPKLENTTIENYAYGYHSSATVFEGCTFGSNHYHVMYEFGSQDDNIFDSLYVPAVIPCLVNCFKLLIHTTQKDCQTWYNNFTTTCCC